MQMKEKWKADEVKALPTAEHDYFERKSGTDFEKEDVRKTLSKAISALANSGGGHLLLGVKDDGEFDGVSKERKGRTTTKDWLEQIIPELVDPTLSNFRVHAVEDIDPAELDESRTVIVIDVGDSDFAPHQSRSHVNYFYRPGGRSEPAPHFYLDALRNRAERPVLKVELESFRPILGLQDDHGVRYQFLLSFRISNLGYVTPRHWHLELANAEKPLDRHGGINCGAAIHLGLSRSKFRRIMDVPILPGMSRLSHDVVWVQPTGRGTLVFAKAFGDFVKAVQQFDLTARVVTDTRPCEPCKIKAEDLLRHVSENQLVKAMHNVPGGGDSGYLAYRLKVKDIVEHPSAGGKVKVTGVVENHSGNTYRDLNLLFRAMNNRDVVISEEVAEIGFVEHGESRKWTVTHSLFDSRDFYQQSITAFDTAWLSVE